MVYKESNLCVTNSMQNLALLKFIQFKELQIVQSRYLAHFIYVDPNLNGSAVYQAI
jgi:hypothetical protein